MAQWRCKTTGTRNTGTPGVENDWSDAQCYELFDLFFNHEDHISDEDVILLDDETHSVDFLRCPDLLATGGDVAISSRSGSAANCAISGNDGANTDMLLNPTGASAPVNFTFSGIAFTKSVAHTDNNSPNIYFVNECGDVTFDRCVFRDFITNASNDNASLNGLMKSQFSGILSDRTITFTDCRWQNVSQTWNGTVNANVSGLMLADSGTTVTFTGTNTVDTFNAIWTADSPAAGSAGLFRIEGTGDLNVSGVLSFSNINTTVASAGAANEGCIYCNHTTGKASVTGKITFTNVNTQGGSANAFGLRCNGLFEINAIEGADCFGFNANPGLGLGGIFLSQSSNASGTINSILATRCKSRQGVVAETSGGGSMTLKSFVARDCEATTGIVYLGGDGDAIIESGLIRGSKGLQESPPTTALDLYIHLNELTAARSAVRQINNVTILDSEILNVASVFPRNVDATHSLSVIFNNCVFDSGLANELQTLEGGTAVLNVTLNNCAYTDISKINNSITNGTWANNDPTEALDLGVKDDGSLQSSSPLVKAGIRWWVGSNPVGVDGEPFSTWETSVGSRQSTDVPFHPLNL